MQVWIDLHIMINVPFSNSFKNKKQKKQKHLSQGETSTLTVHVASVSVFK